MKQNKVKLYAKALAEVISEKKPARQNAAAFGAKDTNTDKLVKNFVQLLEKNGQMRRAKEIVLLAEDFLLAKQGKRKITFQTARKITAGQKKILQGLAKEGDVINEKISPEIIAGIKIIINDSKQFDASLQKKLQEIF